MKSSDLIAKRPKYARYLESQNYFNDVYLDSTVNKLNET